MTSPYFSGELIAAARVVLQRGDEPLIGIWPRAAAFLGRQAIEHSLDDLWQREAPELSQVSRRAQFIVLRAYVDAELAARAYFLWSTLSRACHHHAYELPPTAGELESWLAGAQEVFQQLLAAPRATAGA